MEGSFTRAFMSLSLFAGAALAILAADAVAPRTSDGSYLSWREHRIDDEQLAGVPLRGGDGVALADLDRDGFIDVVSVHEDSSHVRVAFGSEDPTRWVNITLASGEAVGGCEDVAVADLNDDRRLDIVIASEAGNITYFQAPKKTRNIAAWKTTVLNATLDRGSWIRVRIADVNGDGRPDIVGTNKAGPGRSGTFSYFVLNGRSTDSDAWHEVVVGRAVYPINARPIDIDADGDLDIVGASWGEESIFLFENVSDGRWWKKHTVHTGRDPLAIGFMLEFSDLNGDGRLDIVSGTGPRWQETDEIHWFAQPADLGWQWAPRRLGSIHPDRATGMLFIDLSGDGKEDLLVGGYSWEPWDHEPWDPKPTDSCGRLAWFERPEDPAAPWIRHDISRRRRGMFDLFVAHDVNRDGLVDVVTTRGNSSVYDGVIWLEQVRSAEPGPAFVRARATDSPEIPLPEETAVSRPTSEVRSGNE